MEVTQRGAGFRLTADHRPARLRHSLRYRKSTKSVKKKQPRKSELGAPARADHSDLVEIYLWEGDVETAWTEAKGGSCHGALWLRLAEARAKDNPEDAIAVYSEQLKPALQWAQQSTYEQAVHILRKIRKLMMRIGKQAEFVSLVESMRAQ